MGRLRGVEPREAGWLTRLAYRLFRRYLGRATGTSRLVEPIKITAHHPRLLLLFGLMEVGQDGARSVPAALKSLAALKADAQIGCPF
jgi:hypothetical protein